MPSHWKYPDVVVSDRMVEIDRATLDRIHLWIGSLIEYSKAVRPGCYIMPEFEIDEERLLHLVADHDTTAVALGYRTKDGKQG